MNLHTFDHQLFSSFKEKLDNAILRKLGAFQNVTIDLIEDTKDDRSASYSIAASNGRQWVYDSSIAGATIASSDALGGDWTGSNVDFTNGRLIGSSGLVDPAPSINVAQKYFNSYMTTKSDEELFNQVYFDEGNEQIAQTEAVKGDSYYSPSYFVKLAKTNNEGFAFGGEDKTNYMINVSVFVRTEFELLAIAGVFRDMANTSGHVLDSTPLNEFSDLKDGPWSYADEMVAMKAAGAARFHIESVEVNPITSELLGKKLSNISIGLARFKLFSVRTPRLD